MFKFSLFIIILVISPSVSAFSYTKQFTEAEIQKAINTIMPLEKQKMFLTIVISDPKIELIEKTNQIGVFSRIKLKAPGGIAGTGSTKIKGSISYNAKKGAFYLKNPQIVDLKIDNISESIMPKIKNIAQSFLSSELKRRPIYRFRSDNIKQKLAKAVLQSVTVKNKTIEVVLSAF